MMMVDGGAKSQSKAHLSQPLEEFTYCFKSTYVYLMV